eukprot:171615-Chlamydomonas_euryale.AAC.3
MQWVQQLASMQWAQQHNSMQWMQQSTSMQWMQQSTSMQLVQQCTSCQAPAHTPHPHPVPPPALTTPTTTTRTHQRAGAARTAREARAVSITPVRGASRLRQLRTSFGRRPGAPPRLLGTAAPASSAARRHSGRRRVALRLCEIWLRACRLRRGAGGSQAGEGGRGCGRFDYSSCRGDRTGFAPRAGVRACVAAGVLARCGYCSLQRPLSAPGARSPLTLLFTRGLLFRPHQLVARGRKREAAATEEGWREMRLASWRSQERSGAGLGGGRGGRPPPDGRQLPSPRACRCARAAEKLHDGAATVVGGSPRQLRLASRC